MTNPLSNTASALRVCMFSIAAMLLALGVWKIPGMDLSRVELVIAWLTVALAVGQFAAVALCAPCIRQEPGLRSPLIISQFIGLILFIGIIFELSYFGEMEPKQLRLVLMLSVNGVATCTLLGVLWPNRD